MKNVSFPYTQFVAWLRAHPRVAFAGLLLLGLGAWALMLPSSFGHNHWVYSWDSAPYLETAESLHAGRGLSHRVIHGLGAEIWEPLTLWPPGYPLLIAAVMTLGVSAKTACLIVSVGAAGLSIALLALIASRLVPWRIAAALVVVVAVSTPFQTISTQCLSDTTYYFWTLASTACVVEWARRRDASWGWMLGAGLFAGVAFCTRNAALALFAATGVLFLAQLAWRRFAEVFRAGLIWSGGVAALVAPMMLYNLSRFGKLNPYDMPPSDLSLDHNLRRAVSVVVSDMTAIWPLAGIAFERTFVILAFGAVLVATAVWLGAKRLPSASLASPIQRYSLPLFVTAYALATAALVVIARTKYRWGEEVSSRYLVQVYWGLWISVAVWGAAVLSQTRLNPRVRSTILTVVFVVAAAMHLRDARGTFLNPPTPDAQSLEAQIGADGCEIVKETKGDHQIVLATRADLLRIHCGLNARPIPAVKSSDSLRRPLTEEGLEEAMSQGHFWGFVIHDPEPVLRGEAGAVLQEIVSSPEQRPEFVRVPVAGSALVLRYVAEDDPLRNSRPET